jgi:hypothetical protein
MSGGLLGSGASLGAFVPALAVGVTKLLEPVDVRDWRAALNAVAISDPFCREWRVHHLAPDLILALAPGDSARVWGDQVTS